MELMKSREKKIIGNKHKVTSKMFTSSVSLDAKNSGYIVVKKVGSGAYLLEVESRLLSLSDPGQVI